MWIESHPELETHPKTLRLQQMLGLDIDQTLGKLHRLWYWVTKYAEDGDISKYGMPTINTIIGLESANNALIECGFIDLKPHLKIHGWWDYCGRYFKLKYRNQPDKLMQIEKKATAYIRTRSRRATDTLKTRLSAPSSLPTFPSFPAFPAKGPETYFFSGRGEKKTATAHPRDCTAECCFGRVR